MHIVIIQFHESNVLFMCAIDVPNDLGFSVIYCLDKPHIINRRPKVVVNFRILNMCNSSIAKLQRFKDESARLVLLDQCQG